MGTTMSTHTQVIRTRIGSKHVFEVRDKSPITEVQAMKLQAFEGYPPQGYGFYRYKCEQMSDGTYKTTWVCSEGCE